MMHRPDGSCDYAGPCNVVATTVRRSRATTRGRPWLPRSRRLRAISTIGEITRRYGYEAPTIDGLESWSAEDRIRDLGGLTPDKQVIVFGVALGPAGQWLSLRFQDPSKDTGGTFEERLRPPEGSQWQMNTQALS